MSMESFSRAVRDVDVMVAEDDKHQCDELHAFFDWSDMSHHIVNDGPSVLQALERFRPKVLILDIRLPGLDGIQVAEQVAKRANPPVTVLVSGHLDSVIAANQRRAQPFPVIEKPVSLKVLGKFIRGVLEKKPDA